MNKKPKVSVIISCYNHEQFVVDTINSILNQSYSNFELLIADDCSQDSTFLKIKSFKDDRISIYQNTSNLGVVRSINNLIRKSNGDLVAFCGSDDIWATNKLERQVHYLLNENSNIDAVFTEVDYIDENNRIITDKLNVEEKLFKYDFANFSDCVKTLFFEGNFLCHPSAVVKKETIDKIGFFNCAFAQLHDYDYWLRLALYGTFDIMHERLVQYRRILVGNTSISAGTSLNIMRSWNEWALIILNFINELNDDKFFEYFKKEGGHIWNSNVLICDKYFLLKKWAEKINNFNYVPVSFILRYINNEEILSILEKDYSYSLGDLYLDFSKLFAEYPNSYYQKFKEMEEALNKAIHNNNMLNYEYNLILNSTSWKITKPLRSIKKLLK